MSSHAIRIWDEDAIYLVTNRCFQSQCLLRPDGSLNPVVVRWLRQTVRIFGLELFAGIVLGDRFTLVLRAPRKNLSKAMGYFQGNLARALNRLRDRRDTIFPERFSAEPILDDGALLEQITTLLKMPVSQGEVAQPGEWPGFTSWHQMTGEASPWLEGIELPPLTVLPMWQELDGEERAGRLRALVEDEDEVSLWPELPSLGPEEVRKRDWRQRTAGPRWRRPRGAFASRPALVKGHARRRARVREAYDMALATWRRGQAAVFPRGTFPPGWSRVSDGGTAAAPPEPAEEVDAAA